MQWQAVVSAAAGSCASTASASRLQTLLGSHASRSVSQPLWSKGSAEADAVCQGPYMGVDEAGMRGLEAGSWGCPWESRLHTVWRAPRVLCKSLCA